MATFTGHENHDIPLSEASAWTANYRNANPGQINGHYFGGDAIQNVLAQTGCVGLRMYYAINDEGVKQLIIVGVNADGNDLVNGLLLDRSVLCPPTCGNSNSLNS
ncbi:MAG: hypothetical protein IT236_07060 [Bacteroidia bacterium]|nr:hypothetical protein [Bacteroidia bacterium]